jgi:hypothetical protein
MDDENRKKRLLLLAVLIVSLFGIIVLVWFFFFSKPTTPKDIVPKTGGLPFGTTLPPRFGFIFGNDQNSQTETEVIPAKERALVRVWDKPTTGNTFVSVPILIETESTTTSKTKLASPTSTPEIIIVKKTTRATSTVLMFVDRTTGFIYGYDKKSDTPYQITNTTIPGIYDAYIFNSGKNVLMRYLDNDKETIVSILSTIPQVSEGESPLPLMNTTLLQKNVSSVAISTSKSRISYLVPNNGGSSIYSLTPKGASLITTSPFSQWLLSYGGEDLYATSKPSAYIEGSTVKLPLFSRMESKRTGLLSIVSPTGVMLNSMWSQSGLTTFISNKGSINVLPIKTIASKCSWLYASPVLLCAIPDIIPQTEEGLPDDWYQGKFLFSDSLQFIDSRSGVVYPLYFFTEQDGKMDAVSLSLTNDNKDISFIRKQDATLWLLKTELLNPEE